MLPRYPLCQLLHGIVPVAPLLSCDVSLTGAVYAPTASGTEPPDAHALGLHVAAVSLPSIHELCPDTVYPWLQVGLHVLPDASAAVQSPLAPLAGAAEASHGLGVHDVVLNEFVVVLSTGVPS